MAKNHIQKNLGKSDGRLYKEFFFTISRFFANNIQKSKVDMKD